jgi:tRNA threonylcarbamoyl adenosine modification protein YeaZ
VSAAVKLPILALDTSGSFCSVAVRTEQGAIVRRESDGAGDHFERLPGLVQAVLAEAKVRAHDLAEIRIGVGPGSFTGLRIGMSFAKGLSVAVRVALRGISSFEGVAQSLSSQFQGRPVEMVVISDARRDEVFACSYVYNPTTGLQSGVASIVPVSWVVQWCREHPEGIVASPLRDFRIDGLESLQVVPRIAEGLLKVEISEQGQFVLADVASLEPAYLRAVAAKTIAERTGA